MSAAERASSMVAATQSAETGVLRGTHAAPAGENPGDGDLFAVFDAEADQFTGQTLAPPKRTAGRPAGSANRSTLALQKWLMARGYRDPAEMLAAIVSADPRQLAADLAGKAVALVKGDEALEVLKLQRSAAVDLMPYFHQRMPQQVEQKGDDMAGRTLVLINNIVAGGAAGPVLQNQGLSAGIVDVSDAQVSDGEGKS